MCSLNLSLLEISYFMTTIVDYKYIVGSLNNLPTTVIGNLRFVLLKFFKILSDCDYDY